VHPDTRASNLLKFLRDTPGVSIGRLFANTSAGKRLDEVVPVFGKIVDADLELFSPEKIRSSDLVYIALPSGEALKLVPQILAEGKRVIDLGGDFRLKDAALYERYYKRPHTAAESAAKRSIRPAGMVLPMKFVQPHLFPTRAVIPRPQSFRLHR